ncbi:MAG TPA: TonB family protein [Gammaproteobacteria bacterium]|nr:TonB family protein [Gammaproteobacteria bacterium]
MRAVLPCAIVVCLATVRASGQGAPGVTEAPPPSEAAAEPPANEATQSALAREALVSRVEATLQFSQLVSDQKYQDALPVGAQMLKLTEREFGRNSVEMAKAYTDVGDAQRLAKSYDDAEKSFLAAIDIYRSIDGALSALVIPPLTGLGDTFHDSGDDLKAVSAYGEARTLNRRAFGLLNEEQIPLIDRMTQSLLSMNQPLQADQQQLEALRLVERNRAPESPEALEALYKYAAWLRDSGRYQEERDQYMRAVRTIRDTYGKDDVRQVRALLGIGNSFRVQRIPEGQGASSLHDALTLLLAQPQRDPLAIAEVLRDLGDWETAFSKVDYDGAEYRRAWQLLGEAPNGSDLRTAWFKGPIYVLREPISQRGLSQDPQAPMGHVLVRFDLDAGGHSTNVTIVESEPPGLKDEAVLRHVRRSRFRPQIVDGAVVPAAGLALQFNYRYSPDALAEVGKPEG